MVSFEEAPDLQKMAKQLISQVESINHVDASEILFFRETETKPKALAKIYKIGDHPIGFFTDKKYVIVVYWACCDYMSKAQIAIMLWHEMLHIPERGDNLIEHDRQDFREILGIDLDWSDPGTQVPDILGKGSEKVGRKLHISPNKCRRKATGRKAESRKQA